MSDLERTVNINKEIIAELLSNNSQLGKSKKIIEMLNFENANLHLQIKKLISERDQAQAKLLLSEQILQNYKKHEENIHKELLNKQKELIDQLNRKEYILQKTESKYEKALSTLNILAHKDQDARKVLKGLKVDRRSGFKLTNVIEENERLQSELVKEREITMDLAMKLNTVKENPPILTNIITDKSTKNTDYVDIKSEQPINLKMKNKRTASVFTGNNDAIKLLNDKIVKLTDKIKELYKINMNLTNALKQANEQISMYKSKLGFKKMRNRTIDKAYFSNNSQDIFTINQKEIEQGVKAKRSPSKS